MAQRKPGIVATASQKVPNISQGKVASRLRCGGIFSDGFVTDLLSSFSGRKKFENQHLAILLERV